MHKKGFPKTERYPSYKHLRGIHACSLDEKVFCGAAVKTVEHDVFEQLSENFLKGVPTHMKARLLRERMEVVGGVYLGLDVTSWESSITPDIAEACELQLFRYMIGHLAPEVVSYIAEETHSIHKIQYRDFTLKVRGGRMSGDLWTSLGNGFTNLMIVKYVCSKLGYDPVGVVEGDDGLFRCDGPVPTKEMFARLGFDSKIEVFNDIGVAGFCKMKFDADDVQVTDFAERLVKFGWTCSVNAGSRRRADLLYTKALSLKAEYPHCPILGPFADYIIRVVASDGRRHKLVFDEDPGWTAHKIENAARWLDEPASVSLSTRLFYAELYGVSVIEQLSIEESFRTAINIQPINHPIVLEHMQLLWSDCYDRFVSEDGHPVVDW